MNRLKMIKFITDHFKYSLLNSWNGVKGYAIKVKVYDMGFKPKVKDFAYDAISTENFYTDHINFLLEDKAEYLKQKYGSPYISLGFNGRMGGYIVLYHLKSKYNDEQTYDEEELNEMDTADIKRLYELLKDFDALKDEIKGTVEELYKSYSVEEQTIYNPEKITVLKEKVTA